MHALPFALTPPNSSASTRPPASFCRDGPVSRSPLGCGLFSFQSDPAGFSRWPTTGPQGTCTSAPSSSTKALMTPNFVTFSSFATRQAASATDLLLYIFSSWVARQLHFPLETSENIPNYLRSSLKTSLTGHKMRRKPQNPTIRRKACICTYFLQRNVLPNSLVLLNLNLLSLGRRSQNWLSLSHLPFLHMWSSIAFFKVVVGT